MDLSGIVNVISYMRLQLSRTSTLESWLARYTDYNDKIRQIHGKRRLEYAFFSKLADPMATFIILDDAGITLLANCIPVHSFLRLDRALSCIYIVIRPLT